MFFNIFKHLQRSIPELKRKTCDKYSRWESVIQLILHH